MVVQVLGISGSAIPNSNTDRAVRYILERTGLETEFVKLSELQIAPCIRCGYGDQCELSEKIRQAVLHEPG